MTATPPPTARPELTHGQLRGLAAADRGPDDPPARVSNRTDVAGGLVYSHTADRLAARGLVTFSGGMTYVALTDTGRHALARFTADEIARGPLTDAQVAALAVTAACGAGGCPVHGTRTRHTTHPDGPVIPTAAARRLVDRDLAAWIRDPHDYPAARRVAATELGRDTHRTITGVVVAGEAHPGGGR